MVVIDVLVNQDGMDSIVITMRMNAEVNLVKMEPPV